MSMKDKKILLLVALVSMPIRVWCMEWSIDEDDLHSQPVINDEGDSHSQLIDQQPVAERSMIPQGVPEKISSKVTSPGAKSGIGLDLLQSIKVISPKSELDQPTLAKAPAGPRASDELQKELTKQEEEILKEIGASGKKIGDNVEDFNNLLDDFNVTEAQAKAIRVSLKKLQNVQEKLTGLVQAKKLTELVQAKKLTDVETVLQEWQTINKLLKKQIEGDDLEPLLTFVRNSEDAYEKQQKTVNIFLNKQMIITVFKLDPEFAEKQGIEPEQYKNLLYSLNAVQRQEPIRYNWFRRKCQTLFGFGAKKQFNNESQAVINQYAAEVNKFSDFLLDLAKNDGFTKNADGTDNKNNIALIDGFARGLKDKFEKLRPAVKEAIIQGAKGKGFAQLMEDRGIQYEYTLPKPSKAKQLGQRVATRARTAGAKLKGTASTSLTAARARLQERSAQLKAAGQQALADLGDQSSEALQDIRTQATTAARNTAGQARAAVGSAVDAGRTAATTRVGQAVTTARDRVQNAVTTAQQAIRQGAADLHRADQEKERLKTDNNRDGDDEN